MLGEGGTPLEEFEAAARKFVARGERNVALKRYRAVIDGLDGDFYTTAQEAKKAGEHLVAGSITAATWTSGWVSIEMASTKKRCSVMRASTPSPSCASSAASPGMSPTPMASSKRLRPTSPNATSTSTRCRTACSRSTGCS